MTYVSIDFNGVYNFWPCESKSVVMGAVFARPSPIYHNSFIFGYTKNGDWIHYEKKPNLIMTEKMNALIANWFRNRPVITDKYKAVQKYNISKFLLLKEIVSQYLVNDILFVIINVSD
jgi:hypothetical protein